MSKESLKIRRVRRPWFAILMAGALVVMASCGGSEASDGERDRNVSGGAAASQVAHPAPYQVGLYRISSERLPKPWTTWREQWGFVCGGVILSANWIATTANCVSTYGAPWDKDRFRVGVGMVDPWCDENGVTRVRLIESGAGCPGVDDRQMTASRQLGEDRVRPEARFEDASRGHAEGQ